MHMALLVTWLPREAKVNTRDTEASSAVHVEAVGGDVARRKEVQLRCVGGSMQSCSLA